MFTSRSAGMSNLRSTFLSFIAIFSAALTANLVHAQITIPSSGDINTIAGNGNEGYSGNGGLATSSELFLPYGVAVDTSGNVYIVDSANKVVRKITASTDIITTIAGGSCCLLGNGGPATSAELHRPSGIAVDSSGNIYIADTGNNMVRKVTASTGIITAVAGNGNYGYSGNGGPATSATLHSPAGVAVDSSGNIYIADTGNQVIRKVTASTGDISTVAGDGTAGYSGNGGAATSAELNDPAAVAVDSSGNVYIADTMNQVVRKVTASTGDISTIAGNGTAGTSGDNGPATSAELYAPAGIAVDGSGNVYVAVTNGVYEDGTSTYVITGEGDNRVRKVTASTGYISTVAGDGTQGYGGDGGAATSAELDLSIANVFDLHGDQYAMSVGVAIDNSGNIYIGDFMNQRVRVVGH